MINVPGITAMFPAPAQGPTLPNWQHHMQHREYALQLLDECPRYLLLPEIDALMGQAVSLTDKLLLQLLFATGARINELLAIVPEDVITVGGRMHLKLRTLKQQRRGAGKIATRDAGLAIRHVPVLDKGIADFFNSYLVTCCPNKRSRVFGFSDETARNRLKHIDQALQQTGIRVPVRLTPKVLRHSFAINLLLNRVDIRQISLWMGHRSLKSTMVYTKLLGFDSGLAVPEISFSMAVSGSPVLAPARVAGPEFGR
ncbi:tyrosine-type recombinase/integrase [Photobacterium sp. R1]